MLQKVAINLTLPGKYQLLAALVTSSCIQQTLENSLRPSLVVRARDRQADLLYIYLDKFIVQFLRKTYGGDRIRNV